MQFTLQTLLLSFVVVASALAAFEAWGLLVAVVILGAVAYIRCNASPLRAARNVFCAFLVVSIGTWLLFPIEDRIRSAACRGKMGQIMLALQNYHNNNGHFPPAYVLGLDGRPWHSWRTLLLPYLGHQALHGQYRFDEPWDGPNNRKLAALNLDCFTCPGDDHHAAGHTNYVAVIGAETAWPGATSGRLQDCRDGASRTIILVETRGDHIGWSEPRDLSFADACAGVDSPAASGISGNHKRDSYLELREPWTAVVFGDGSPRMFGATTPVEYWRAWLTRAGGEEVDMEYGPSNTSSLHWGHIGGLICLVLSTLLLLLRPIRRSNTSPAFADTQACGG